MFPELREMDPAVYREELRRTLSMVLPWGGLLCILAWLPFLITDAQLHPQWKMELRYLRLSLTAAGTIVLLASFVPFLRRQAITWGNLLAFVALSATPAITNLVNNDPRYVSGYMLVLVLFVLFPLPFFHVTAQLTFSMIQYVVIAIVYDRGLFVPEQEYSRNNVFIAFIFSVVMSYVNERARMRAKLRERKLDAKTNELEETLGTVRTLKNKQDGDYFLTSLLIKPLGGNTLHSPVIEAEVLMRQKTRFQFQKWHVEIGGDLAVVHGIKLRGRNYAVFLNGDAMGKSIQGAGGALVLGTVFKSFVTRTQVSSRMQDRFPEQWMRELFLELQTVFISFDGSMLTSAAAGLIDEMTGTLYHMQAEHPALVLLRHGKAEFIEPETALPKIGIAGFDDRFTLSVLRLEPEDVIIAGSDGRDDLAVGVDGEGNRMINENEKLFLKFVEDTNGNLSQIQDKISGHGEITDDLSLIRLRYHPIASMPSPDEQQALLYQRAKEAIGAGRWQEGADALETALGRGETLEILGDLGKALVHLKQFPRAAQLCERYTELAPWSTEFLFATSFALKHSGDTARAVDFGERARIRRPRLVKNLLNLAELYLRQSNLDRTDELLRQARAIEPENPRLHKIAAALEAKLPIPA